MLKRSYTCLLLLCLTSGAVYADDLNDGIGIDEEINDNLQLNTNIDFIKRNAIAKARRAADGGKGTAGCSGTGNQSFGPGANLKGATIVNLSNNKGATSVCIER
ncbi:MAG: hypothetical protein ACU83N_05530 [Gammaproteobacteria bacterium]